jgi:hypothetical protein
LRQSLFAEAAATFADDEQQFQKARVAVVPEPAAQQLQDRETTLVIGRELQELAQPRGGLAPWLCEL